MRAQFAKTMLELGEADPSLVVLVGDIGAFGLREFAARCPGRFMNAGIREQSMAGVAAGLALTGMIPVIHSITPFVVERCFEQLKDDFAYHQLPGNVVSVGAGLDYAALGGTHHSYSDLALMKSLPGSQVFYPGNPREFDLLFRQSYRSGHLNYFRLGGKSHSIKHDDRDIAVGKAIKIADGKDVTLVASGPLLDHALHAARELARHCSCEIIYCPSIKPFDAELLRESVRKTRRLVIAEDHSVMGGVADEARRALDNCGFAYSFEARGIGKEFVREYGSFDHIVRHAGIGTESLVASVNTLLDRPNA